jgi:large conductance mechanosensitive channel
MLKEFKKFALRGNVMDLAVGIIIGAAFGKIITSLVEDIIMPILGFITGGYNIIGLKWVINNGKGDAPGLWLRYGNFLQSMIDFIIIAFSIFIVIKLINKFRKKEDKSEDKVLSKEEVLLTEIRDILKNK